VKCSGRSKNLSNDSILGKGYGLQPEYRRRQWICALALKKVLTAVYIPSAAKAEKQNRFRTGRLKPAPFSLTVSEQYLKQLKTLCR
jgi:hypothetical protein